MVSTPRLGSPTCCAVSPIIRPPSCTSCCRGIGSNAKSLPLPPDNPPSWPWPDGCAHPAGEHSLAFPRRVKPCNRLWLLAVAFQPTVHSSVRRPEYAFQLKSRDKPPHVVYIPLQQSKLHSSPAPGGDASDRTAIGRARRPPSARSRRC